VEHTLADWEWVFGVNLWGVIYGIRTFVPIMLKQNQPAHIVSTASLAASRRTRSSASTTRRSTRS